MLLTATQSLAFLAAAVLITLSPGPDNLMVLSLGASRGHKRGMVFGLGCALGCLNHTLLAALGVSALIAASVVAFTALKIAGGLYLIYLGVRALKSRGSALAANNGGGSSETLRALFLKGLFANSINPKVVLFFLAFLPQFVDTAQGHAGWQIAQLGLLFTLQAAVLFGTLGYFAGRVGQWLARNPKGGLWLDRVAGGIFVGLGLRLMVSR
ncbi:LysE family translocator [Methylovirgula sp. 4M-Z18]|uniref:LysE family translocator n=1 Tax=Methylovirgula sp. 4M-Z18 TaxID=2293567 RepID=UPI000E2FD614|nr:LysE family translocator [Methylovirgula sp. 4M-Z18]RFB77961.1 LysE family translocator [Methylovirgula sp. 4M-Z18]